MRFITLAFCALAAIPAAAQQPPAIRYTATTSNVSGAGEAIRINLTGWSTDADRDELVDAWTLKPAPAQAAGARGGRGGRGARGADVAPDPAADDPDNPALRFGRGGARGGRGNAAADPGTPAPTPDGSLATAIKKKRTVGMLWTSEIVGYSIKFAYRLPQPDGGERIILATDRRVGAWSNLWKPAGGAEVADYGFSIIELRLNAKGEGEGKMSMNGKIVIDSAKTLALENYAASPVVFKSVKKN